MFCFWEVFLVYLFELLYYEMTLFFSSAKKICKSSLRKENIGINGGKKFIDICKRKMKGLKRGYDREGRQGEPFEELF